MTDDVRDILLGLLASAISAALAWSARAFVGRRHLGRTREFFGLPAHSEALLVVNKDAGGADFAVARFDAYALLELAALIKECGARAQVLAHDEARRGFGELAEFCVGGPYSNRRTAAHLAALLPGIRVETDPSPERNAFVIGGERYALDHGQSEYVLLARLTTGREELTRPVFLLCGQRSVNNQAAARYLVTHRERLRRRYRRDSFVLLLRVVNSAAYGPDVVELVGDVTRLAMTRAEPAPETGRAPDTAET
ncbi:MULTISPECIES: hypothetical protein [unclassified Streptomyces]|uniref:hypothetical protein n=1 Tax=unclassified Streptomyces TaxID=2593676 RepID=UPI00081E1293|nr:MULTISPECIES: hypothetical protein [unclassified Streptomyces]MYR28352.1 hypothetical protein [Streptomyces sp. SID4945]SCF36789.1 hypothetical protein GA0115257_113868 [Streptomyces sp. LcepLS]